MLRIIYYRWKRLIRDKANTFWILLFPIILGTFFHIAFSNAAASENMETIPVAVILSDDAYGDALQSTCDSLATGEEPFLDVTYCDEEKATALLEDKEIVGIITSGKQVTLTVSGNMTNQSMMQSILESFVNEYNMYQTVLIDIAENHPEQLQTAVSEMTNDIEYNETASLSRNPDQNPLTQYFYNLLAMTCLFTAVGGVSVACDNQANLSDLAMRRSISPTHKLKTIVGELIASVLYEFVFNLVGFAYLALVLKIDLTSRLPLTLLTMFLGCAVGTTLGFCIGCIGRMDRGSKQGLVFAVTMPLCFLSGLMFGNMMILIENHVPILNRINPASLLTDCFYRLSQYHTLTRYACNMITLVILSIAFCLLGFFMTRRKKYAQL